jgi:iron complex transport system substrate-binding protein
VFSTARSGARRPLVCLAALLLGAAGCRETPPRTSSDTAAVPRPAVPAATDDFGAPVPTGRRPSRIVSLNPTTTELLFALGAGDRLVGRTHWDQYPAEARAVPDLGPGIRPNVEAVLAARPELVLLYASGDNRAAASSLRAAGIHVVALKVDRIADFLRCVRIVGDAIGERARADTVADSVARSLDAVRAVTASVTRPRVLWPLFAEPLYVIGGGSFMSELVQAAGGMNVFGDLPQPSPQVGREEVLRRDADVVIAAPSSVKRILGDPTWRSLTAVRTRRVYADDTTLVERPSVRLGEAARSIALLLHPELRERLAAAPR